jgi:ATP-dependent Lhr-like helicase
MSDSSISDFLIKRFGSLTEVQKQAIPLVHQGKNVLIIAPTGSGKTETAVIPVMHKIKEQNMNGIAAIYITPLRALNRDMLKRLSEYADELGISISVRHGDTTTSERSLQAKNPPKLLITTPETLQAILPAKVMGEHLKNVRFVIIDELHELFDSKRGIQLSVALERLAERAGEFQRIGLSATVSDPIQLSHFLCGYRQCDIVDLKYLKSMQFEILYPKPTKGDEQRADELQLDGSAYARLNEIKKRIENEKTLIFVNTRSIAEILGSRLMKVVQGVAVHHGSLSKDVRIQLEDDFKSGRLKALVATSSLELGIDIGDVSQVIQYMSPRQVARLVQRTGRSGHSVKGTSKGTVICADPDDVFESHALLNLIHHGVLEEQEMCKNALDVLAHQIAGILMETEINKKMQTGTYKIVHTVAGNEEPRDEIGITQLFEIIKRAYPYSTLSADDFLAVIDFMHDKRLLKKTERNTVHKMSSTRIYYYENLSTIPSVEKYLVKDTATNKVISVLDEDFVSFLQVQDSFITKGLPWRILDIDQDRRIVMVEAAEDINAAIPDWEGEEIPTSFEVSQEVGSIKRRVKELVAETLGKEKIKKMDENKVEEAAAHVAKHVKVHSDAIVDYLDMDLISNHGLEYLPDDNTILIEGWNEVAVMHVAGGLNANRTLAEVLGHLLSTQYKSTVKTLVDPYRIAFIFQAKADPAVIKGLLTKLARSQDLDSTLQDVVSRHKLFKYKFIHIGKMFYLFKEAPRISDSFIQYFQGSPVYKETLRDVYSSYYDLKHAKEILNRINQGSMVIHAVRVQKLTSVGMRALVRSHGSELIAPIEPTSEIIKAFKAKLLGKSVVLFCTHCGKDWITFIGSLPDQGKIKCPKCGSSMVALVPGFVNVSDVKKLFTKKKLTKEEKEYKMRLERSAGIISSAGKRGVIALSSYGVGPTKAASLLSRTYKDENEFFAALLEAQKTFIRTRRFWEFH